MVPAGLLPAEAAIPANNFIQNPDAQSDLDYWTVTRLYSDSYSKVAVVDDGGTRKWQFPEEGAVMTQSIELDELGFTNDEIADILWIDVSAGMDAPNGLRETFLKVELLNRSGIPVLTEMLHDHEWTTSPNDTPVGYEEEAKRILIFSDIDVRTIRVTIQGCSGIDSGNKLFNGPRFNNVYVEIPGHTPTTANTSESQGGHFLIGGKYYGSPQYFKQDAVKTLQAVPTGNHRFARWSDGTTENPRTATLKDNQFPTPEFSRDESLIDNGNLLENPKADKGFDGWTKEESYEPMAVLEESDPENKYWALSHFSHAIWQTVDLTKKGIAPEHLSKPFLLAAGVDMWGALGPYNDTYLRLELLDGAEKVLDTRYVFNYTASSGKPAIHRQFHGEVFNIDNPDVRKLRFTLKGGDRLENFSLCYTYFDNAYLAITPDYVAPAAEDPSIGRVEQSYSNDGVLLNARPTSGLYAFSEWTDGSTENPRLMLPQDASGIKARFVPADFDGSNLLLNSKADYGAEGWNISGDMTAEDGVWKINGLDQSMSQVVDLIQAGFTSEELDAAPKIKASVDMQTDKLRDFRLTVDLLDGDGGIIETRNVSRSAEPDGYPLDRDLYTVEFLNYGTGVRKIRYSVSGSCPNGGSMSIDNCMLTVAGVEYATLSVTIAEGQEGTVSANRLLHGKGLYRKGASVELVAIPPEPASTFEPAFIFDSWSDGSIENPHTVVLDNDLSLTCTFKGIERTAGANALPNPDASLGFEAWTASDAPSVETDDTGNKYWTFSGLDQMSVILDLPDMGFSEEDIKAIADIRWTADLTVLEASSASPDFFIGIDLLPADSDTPVKSFSFDAIEDITNWHTVADRISDIDDIEFFRIRISIGSIPGEYNLWRIAADNLFLSIDNHRFVNLTASSEGALSGYVKYQKRVLKGHNIPVEACPAILFRHWEDDSTDNPRIVTANEDMQLHATFVPLTDLPGNLISNANANEGNDGWMPIPDEHTYYPEIRETEGGDKYWWLDVGNRNLWRIIDLEMQGFTPEELDASPELTFAFDRLVEESYSSGSFSSNVILFDADGNRLGDPIPLATESSRSSDCWSTWTATVKDYPSGMRKAALEFRHKAEGTRLDNLYMTVEGYDYYPLTVENTAPLYGGIAVDKTFQTASFPVNMKAGSTVTATAGIAYPDSRFDGWSDKSTLNPRTFTIDKPTIISLRFSNDGSIDNTNLLLNGRAYNGSGFWSVINDLESDPMRVMTDFSTGRRSWGMNYYESVMSQTINLVQRGFSPEELDACPEIIASVDFESVNPRLTFARIELLDADGNVIGEPTDLFDGAYASKVSTTDVIVPLQSFKKTLSGYGKGVRSLRMTLQGAHSNFSDGMYEKPLTKFSNAYISVNGCDYTVVETVSETPELGKVADECASFVAKRGGQATTEAVPTVDYARIETWNGKEPDTTGFCLRFTAEGEKTTVAVAFSALDAAQNVLRNGTATDGIDGWTATEVAAAMRGDNAAWAMGATAASLVQTVNPADFGWNPEDVTGLFVSADIEALSGFADGYIHVKWLDSRDEVMKTEYLFDSARLPESAAPFERQIFDSTFQSPETGWERLQLSANGTAAGETPIMLDNLYLRLLDTPFGSVGEAVADSVRIFAADGKIRLIGATGEVRLYNTRGQLLYCGTVCDRDFTLPVVPPQGVYIVQTAAKTAKVVLTR